MPKTNTWSLTNGTIWTDQGLLKKASLTVRGTQFQSLSIRKKNPSSQFCLNLENHILLPGLIDLHVNGIGVCDLVQNQSDALDRFSLIMAQKGVTSFLPTLITTPVKQLEKQLSQIVPLLGSQWKGAKPLGLHLEGPFIDPKRKGAHSEKRIETLSEVKLKQILLAGKGQVKMMTLAPEKDPLGNSARMLKKFRVKPAMGHSNATYKQGIQAIQNGYHYATHLFNAMRPWHHREPGLAGAALANDSVYCECIPDGKHLAYPVLDMVLNLKEKDKVILASDEWVGYSKKDKVKLDSTRGGLCLCQVRNFDGKRDFTFRRIKGLGKKFKKRLDRVDPPCYNQPFQILGSCPKNGLH